MKLLLLSILAAVAFGFVLIQPRAIDATGTPVAPLLSCPNVDGSMEGGIRVSDILAVVQAYHHDWPATNYYPLYDLVDPYNSTNSTGGQQRVNDILNVIQHYHNTCPLVDTQVAQATLWVINQHPELLTENVAALSAAGYLGGGIDVPGQGKHYVKLSNWDATFDPAAPEGLVYKNGRLVAELYVVNGNNVGWVPEDPGPNEGPCGDGIDNGGDGFTDSADADCMLLTPSGPPPDDVDIDQFVYCGLDGTGQPNACSWNGNEGWHLHYFLCWVHMGTPDELFVFIDPATHTPPYDDDCADLHNATPGSGTWSYADRLGWMGHLWNWLPNANRVPDVNGTMNGRFADCFPDRQGWTAYNCPQ